MPITNYYSIEGEIEAMKVGSSPRVDLLPDALGSAVTVTDVNRTVKRTARWAPYGAQVSASGSVYEWGWAGAHGYRRTCVLNSDLYVRARHYSTRLGRWTTVDPLWPDERAYAYVGGNPATWIDPSGLKQKNLSPGECIALARRYADCLKTLLDELRDYNPWTDVVGGHPNPKSKKKKTSPFGHWEEIRNAKNCLFNRIHDMKVGGCSRFIRIPTLPKEYFEHVPRLPKRSAGVPQPFQDDRPWWEQPIPGWWPFPVFNPGTGGFDPGPGAPSLPPIWFPPFPPRIPVRIPIPIIGCWW